MDLGSRQYSGISFIASPHIKKIKKCSSIEEFKSYIKDNLDTIIEIDDLSKEELFVKYKDCLYEDIIERYDLEISIDELKSSIENNTINQIEIGDEDEVEDILERIPIVFELESAEDAILYTNDNCWDLWGCLDTFTFNLIWKDGFEDDTKYAIEMLYLIWKFNIKNPEKIFTGFAT